MGNWTDMFCWGKSRGKVVGLFFLGEDMSFKIFA